MVLWQNNIYFELFDKYFDSFAVNFTNSTSGLPVIGLVYVRQSSLERFIHDWMIIHRQPTWTGKAKYAIFGNGKLKFIVCCPEN